MNVQCTFDELCRSFSTQRVHSFASLRKTGMISFWDVYVLSPARFIYTMFPNLIKNKCSCFALLEHLQRRDYAEGSCRRRAGLHTGRVQGEENRAAVTVRTREGLRERVKGS